MGLQDYVYRLKAQGGDSTPHDETGTSGDLSGGTITLVDRGSGDYAWQFSGGPASVSIPSYALQTTTTGGGFTVAARVRISNYGSTDFQYFVGVGANAATGTTDQGNGVVIGREGVNTIRTRYRNESAPASWTQGTTEVTVVVVSEMNYSGGSDRLTTYRGATSVSTGAFNASSNTIDTVWVQAQSGAVVQVADLVVWYEELSSTDCQTLRDSGINATLDAGGTSPVEQDYSASYTVIGSVWQDLTASYALDGAVQTDFAASYSIKTSAQQDLVVSYNILGPAGVALNVDPDHVLGNNTGSIWANTEFKLTFYRADTDAFVVNKTVTTNASGLLGVVSDAALTAGVNYDIKIKRTANPADMGLFNATAA